MALENSAPRHAQLGNSGFSLALKLCVVLGVIALALYANTLWNGYVMDDGIVITENTFVKQGFKGIPEILSTPRMRGCLIAPNDMYRPLSLIMFAVEYEFFGLNPLIGHLVNILVFAFSVILLFLFFNRLFDGRKIAVAFITALLFAVHPIHTEVVANIKSRDELLCFCFAFLALNMFMEYMKKGNVLRLITACIILFLSYLSKETVIAFLAIIPLVFFFYYKESRRRAIYILTGTALVTIVFILIRTAVLTKYNANQVTVLEFMDNALSQPPSVVSGFATKVVVLGKYLLLMLVPYPLVCDYAYNAIPFADLTSIAFWLSLVAYLALCCIAVVRWMKNKQDLWALGIFFYLCSLLLFSNIPFLIGAEMGERFAFFASVGYCFLIALIAERYVPGLSSVESFVQLKSNKVLIALIPLLLIYSCMTIARNADWKSNYSLFKHDMGESPNNSRLYLYTSSAIMREVYPFESDEQARAKLEEECIAYLNKAIAIYPGYSKAHTELAHVYSVRHMDDSADKHTLAALEIGKPDAVAYYNEANKYYTSGKYGMAIYLLNKSIEIRPEIQYPYYTLGNVYLQLKRYDSAVKNFNRAISIVPGYVEAHIGAGTAYYMLQNLDSSEFHLKQAINYAPNDPNNYYSLGILYLNFKKYPGAITQFQIAIAKDKNYIKAYSGVAFAYYHSGHYAEAIDFFIKEAELNPNEVKNVPFIANAYKYSGNMDMAIKYEALARQYFPDFKLE